MYLSNVEQLTVTLASTYNAEHYELHCKAVLLLLPSGKEIQTDTFQVHHGLHQVYCGICGRGVVVGAYYSYTTIPQTRPVICDTYKARIKSAHSLLCVSLLE